MLADIADAAAAANRIQAMRVPDRTEGNGMALDLNTLGDDDRGVRIELQDVWFRYPTRDVPVLNGLNMTVSTLIIVILDKC
jgi:ABC-type multidrug transport system fused ATPase/permease subunit